MINRKFVPSPLTLVRLATAATFVIHGVHRIVHGGNAPFGEFLSSQGFPAGLAFAWTVSVVEVAGGLSLLAGWLVLPLCLWFFVQTVLGIILVHAPHGWFVVGAGRNGVEFSVLLLVCLLAIALERVSSRPGRHAAI
jgi:putative oxidoreductase